MRWSVAVAFVGRHLLQEGRHRPELGSEGRSACKIVDADHPAADRFRPRRRPLVFAQIADSGQLVLPRLPLDAVGPRQADLARQGRRLRSSSGRSDRRSTARTRCPRRADGHARYGAPRGHHHRRRRPDRGPRRRVVVHRLEGLAPGTDVRRSAGSHVTHARPPRGELLCRFATVNDVHFGEVEAGRIDDDPTGPIQRAAPGEPPYPETMNRGAVAEIAALDARRRDREGRPDQRRSARGVGGVRGRATAARSATGCTWCAATTTPTRARPTTPATSGSSCPAWRSRCSTPSSPPQTTGTLTAEQLDWLDDARRRRRPARCS